MIDSFLNTNNVHFFQLIGVREEKHIDIDDDVYEVNTDYIVFLKYDDETQPQWDKTSFYELRLETLGHMCGSGYCGASSGSHHMKKMTHPPKDIHYKPIYPIENNIVILKKDDLGCLHIHHVLLDITFAGETGDGGDGYYPSGSSYFNYSDLFAKTERYTETMPIFIIRGGSHLGKSYFGNMFRDVNQNVYETDSNKHLPEKLSANIVINGNKYNFSLEQIKKCYSKLRGDVKFIIVDFHLD